MTSTPGKVYPCGAGGQPDERPLHLQVRHLRELHEALSAMGDEPRIEIHDDFVIEPAWKIRES